MAEADGKKVVAQEDIPSYLEMQVKDGSPLSIEQMFLYTYPKYAHI